jgi:hypothetical protein
MSQKEQEVVVVDGVVEKGVERRLLRRRKVRIGPERREGRYRTRDGHAGRLDTVIRRDRPGLVWSVGEATEREG